MSLLSSFQEGGILKSSQTPTVNAVHCWYISASFNPMAGVLSNAMMLSHFTSAP